MHEDSIYAPGSRIVHISKAPKYTGVSLKTLRNWRSSGKNRQIFLKPSGLVYVNLDEWAKIVEASSRESVETAKRLGDYVA